MADTAIFDVDALKERIRKFRTARVQIDEDRRQLDEEVSHLENKLATLRQELNIIGSSNELQGGAADEFTEDSNPEAMKKFRIWNDKLDMQILNQEMRTALPGLEKEALKWEAKSKGQQKVTNKNEKDSMRFPSVMLKSSQEIEDQIGNVMDARYEIKSHTSHDIATKKKEKADICNEIATFRRRLAVLEDEEGPMQRGVMKLRQALQLELRRIAIIRLEHIETRQMFSLSSSSAGSSEAGDMNSLGWREEAFLSLVESRGKGREGRDSLVSIFRIGDVLQKWIVPNVEVNIPLGMHTTTATTGGSKASLLGQSEDLAQRIQRLTHEFIDKHHPELGMMGMGQAEQKQSTAPAAATGGGGGGGGGTPAGAKDGNDQDIDDDDDLLMSGGAGAAVAPGGNDDADNGGGGGGGGGDAGDDDDDDVLFDELIDDDMKAVEEGENYVVVDASGKEEFNLIRPAPSVAAKADAKEHQQLRRPEAETTTAATGARISTGAVTTSGYNEKSGYIDLHTFCELCDFLVAQLE